jgi:hypothetical protein
VDWSSGADSMASHRYPQILHPWIFSCGDSL